jgi:hypothetical protein
MRHNRLVVTTFVTRGVRLWLIVRAALSGLLYLAGTNPLRLPIATTLGVLFIAVTAGYVEVHLNHERDLLGNLGIKRRSLVGFFLVPAMIGELLVRAVAYAI